MEEFLSAGSNAAASVPTPTIPHRVRDRAPSQIWAAYEAVRAYELVLPWADIETIHELRIATKWLRYTLEFFGETLGPTARASLVVWPPSRISWAIFMTPTSPPSSPETCSWPGPASCPEPRPRQSARTSTPASENWRGVDVRSARSGARSTGPPSGEPWGEPRQLCSPTGGALSVEERPGRSSGAYI